MVNEFANMKNMKYELALKQKLVLTPQLYQTINILSLDLVELRGLIDKELIENPLLEIKQQGDAEGEEIGEIREKENYKGPSGSDSRLNQPEGTRKDDWEEQLSYLKKKDNQNFLKEAVAEKEKTFEDFFYYSESLPEYLLTQLGIAVNEEIDYKIGEYLIGNLNDDGYLTVSLEEVAGDLGVEIDKVEEILFLIQSFDPPGIGARNLEECLLLQAKYLNINDAYLEKIIKDYLGDLAVKAYPKIAKALDLSVGEVQALADIIKKNFDPRPGRKIGNLKEIRYTIPDLTIIKVEDSYRIVLNEGYLPPLRISSLYESILHKDKIDVDPSRADNGEGLLKRYGSSATETKETLEYIKEKLQSAKFLIKGIEQRKKTISQIAEILIDYQKEFLEQGILYLKPLSLKEVAARLGIHESTVSRAIRNKVIQTPRGIFEMKFFFSKGIGLERGEVVSSDRVRKLIKDYIEGEDPLKPWSDQKLAELLSKKEKVIISRRTVAKYRERLKIPPSNLRKRFKV